MQRAWINSELDEFSFSCTPAVLSELWSCILSLTEWGDITSLYQVTRFPDLVDSMQRHLNMY